MSDHALARALVATLPAGLPGLFNPWGDVCPEDTATNTPDAKLERLSAHLDCKPRFLIVGEAPGYQGCRHSGVAFTSERLIMEGAIPRIPREESRLTHRVLPFSEPSATIVWKTLKRLGIGETSVLWNALQLHPHKPDDIRSNRTPSAQELALGQPAMKLLLEAFPGAKVVAVGKKAEGLLHAMGIATAGAVRHPANGGATAFANGMEAFAKSAD